MKEERRFERKLAHAPEKVWRALTESDALTAWFPGEPAAPITPDADLLFTLDGGEARGEVLEWQPPTRLAYTMGDETLRWELHAIPEGCLLVFTVEIRIARPANDVTAVRAAA